MMWLVVDGEPKFEFNVRKSQMRMVATAMETSRKKMKSPIVQRVELMALQSSIWFG